MQLDIDMSGDALTDWIPAHLLSSDTPTTSEAYDGLQEPISDRANDAVLTHNEQPEYDDYDSNDDDGSGYDDDEDQMSTASEDIVANLQALDVRRT
jgi:hypothetical protein